MSLSHWICQFPVHLVVGKYKIIQCSVTCAMTTFALKNATRTLTRFSGKSISWLKWRAEREDSISCEAMELKITTDKQVEAKHGWIQTYRKR